MGGAQAHRGPRLGGAGLVCPIKKAPFLPSSCLCQGEALASWTPGWESPCLVLGDLASPLHLHRPVCTPKLEGVGSTLEPRHG